MEFTTIKFEFNMKALFNAYFHLDWSIAIRFSTKIRYNEFFFFRYPIIISIYDNIDVIPESNDYSIIRFKLLFNPVELEIVRNIIRQRTRRF